jgi:glycosyltransferase involved in cell wall biosynthesis
MTNKNMLVSVITPTLNGGKFIEMCIKSVKNQTKSVEHIIIDGGSSDNTLDIIKRHPEITSIHEPDTGMYDAINKGLKLANGEIIGYLNTDDRYYSDTISKVLYIFKNKPEVDFVYGACTYINHNEEELYTFKPLPYSNKLFRNMKRICWAQPSCFWRKNVHDKIGYFNSSLKYCGDHVFFRSLILNNFQGVRINSPLSLFMIHDNSLSVKSKNEMFKEFKEIELNYNFKKSPLLGFVGEMYFKLINIFVYLKIGKK